MSTWPDIDACDDHYLGLAGANVVATESLLALRDNLADVVQAKAMMCVHGDAGLGKTLSVAASLVALAPAGVCRVQFRARPTRRGGMRSVTVAPADSPNGNGPKDSCRHDGKSRVTGDCHARFRGSRGVRSPPATRLLGQAVVRSSR